MMETQYAQAIGNALAKGVEENKLVEGLMKRLKETGRMKLLPGIKRALIRELARRETLAPHVEASDEKHAAEAKKAAAAVGIKVEKVAINPSLILGWRARIGSSLVDVSAKKELIDIYRKITN